MDGLTSAQAAARLAADGPNELPQATRRTLLQSAWDVVRQPMLVLLLGAGTINFVLAEPLDGAVLMSFVLVVIGVSLYQERKTENALAVLRDLSAPRATVVRDGRQVMVPGREVVVGDLVLLAEGDRVAADAVLLTTANLSADESMLTGESVPVLKASAGDDAADAGLPVTMGRPGGDGTPWVYSGTMVVQGHGTARVLATGGATEFGRIGHELGQIEQERTPLQREVDRVVGVIAVVGLAAAVLVSVVYGLTRGNWLTGVLAGIGTAMAMLPEEFPVVLTVFLALGAWRLSQHRVLTRRPPVVETLGSATVVCVDKTGTLTMNRMTVRELVLATDHLALDEGPLPQAFASLATYAALACPPDPYDPTDLACIALAERHLSAGARPWHGRTPVREYPLTPGLLALCQVWPGEAANDLVVAAKGAPEAVAGLCRLGPPALAALIDQVEAATRRGFRVLAVARATAERTVPLPDDPRDFAFTYVGLVCLQDPVRPGVPAAVAECTRAGVRTLMITGDYPGTALAIAREIGLDTDAGCITGPELEAMTDQQLTDRIRTVEVFARMVPEQKLRLVRALKANGEIVAMTGDGVNDAPALRAADIGIAMGARGTDVAREAAALVITDDDFASIAGGVRQGRGIYANLRKSMAYVLAVHIPMLGMSLVPVFVPGWPLVLLPSLIALLELIIDPACSVVFEAEQVDPAIMDQPPRPVGAPMFDRHLLAIALLQGVSVLLAVLAVFGWALAGGRAPEVVRSATFVTLVVGNIGLIAVNRSWTMSVLATFRRRKNPTVRWILGGAGLLLVLLLEVPVLRRAFQLGPLDITEWMVAIGAGLLGLVWFELYSATRRRPTRTAAPHPAHP